MSQELKQWHVRLDKHFKELLSQKVVMGADRTIFALEHGLNSTEMKALATGVRAHVASHQPFVEHSLPWVVYAAEIGYRYSGYEYWQTFDEKTPGWIIQYRDWLRDRFRWFHKHYAGAKPHGSWAEHFSIICWPITHAILPIDLQRQLAKILYEIRDYYSAELFESPIKLGTIIAARSWSASSRFQDFTQDKLLVGQIAAALLLDGKSGTKNQIYPPTLNRITRNLDRERRGREWLRGARHFAQERAQIRGLALGGVLPSSRSSSDAHEEVAALGIEPRLVLRPIDETATFWEVLLEIPDLSHLLIGFPHTREILTAARCVVAGAGGRPLARESCLHGKKKVSLKRWPRPDEVLLQFEKTDPQLEYLLSTECLLRPGPLWLFRMASDGLAYEQRGLRVRPGEKYIIVSSARLTSRHIRPIGLQCDGVQAALLNLPSALTLDWEETLRRLGLGQAKTIEVWPCGLAATLWDGEGHGEWLASERPCLGICTDHRIETLVVRCAESSIDLSDIDPGEPVFIELPQLPIGLHTVHVSARTGHAPRNEVFGSLNVVMRIREARPWSPGVSPQGPLIVQMDPTAPTFEQIWEGRAEVTIQGPTGRNVRCFASFFEREGAPAAFNRTLPPIRLPVSPDQWRAHFEKHFRETNEASAAYDAARICELAFSADELGAFTIRCDREFTPIRWSIRRRGRDHFVQLLDDSGKEEAPTVSRLAFETPCVEKALPIAPEYHVPTCGGMYIARLRNFDAIIIAPPVVRDLADLGCAPNIDCGTRSTETILKALELAGVWGRGRLSGDFRSVMRQRDVLRAFANYIFRFLGGESWARAEIAARDRNQGAARLQEAITRRPDQAAIAIILARDCTEYAAITCNERVQRISSLVMRFHLITSTQFGAPVEVEWLSELALRLASDPADVCGWAGEKLRAGLMRLMEVPTLARAARFIVLTTAHHLHSEISHGGLYAGWRWA